MTAADDAAAYQPPAAPTRPGIPDEALVRWDVRHRDGTAATWSLWHGEIRRDLMLGPLFAQLDAIARRVSAGSAFL